MKKLAYSLLSIFVFCLIILFQCYLDEKTYDPGLGLTYLVKRYSDKLESKEKVILRLYGFNHSDENNNYDGKIHLIDLMYSIDKGMDYKEGREFFYKLADGLLEEINKIEKLKTGLFNFPLTYKDLQLVLDFDYNDKGFLLKDQLIRISIYKNKIIYLFATKDGDTLQLETDQISPDIFMIKGGSSKENQIVRPLPEKEF